jgi:hypothetical protein
MILCLYFFFPTNFGSYSWGRKVEYLDIPLKDSIKGWCLEWFIVENHCKSLPLGQGGSQMFAHLAR